MGEEGLFGIGVDSFEEVSRSERVPEAVPCSIPSFFAVSASSLPVSLRPLAF